VDETIAPGAVPPSPRAKSPTRPAMTRVPRVAKATAAPKTGRTFCHWVSRPPANRINASATMPDRLGGERVVKRDFPLVLSSRRTCQSRETGVTQARQSATLLASTLAIRAAMSIKAVRFNSISVCQLAAYSYLLCRSWVQIHQGSACARAPRLFLRLPPRGTAAIFSRDSADTIRFLSRGLHTSSRLLASPRPACEECSSAASAEVQP
jgi:hypothetical protein